MKVLVLSMVKLYQNTFSRALPATCRFEPSCSQYTYEAIEKYDVLKGGWMAIKRLGRCHPRNPGGYDPVP